MPTLHNQGKARRAKSLMQPSMPVYFLFSSDTASESNVLVPTAENILGATIATTKYLIGDVETSPTISTTTVLIENTQYGSYGISNTDATLASKNAHKIYVEGLLDTNSVLAGGIVKTIYVLSHVQGVVPAGASYLTKANIDSFSNFSYVVEAAHVLASESHITVAPQTKKLIGMILEM